MLAEAAFDRALEPGNASFGRQAPCGRLQACGSTRRAAHRIFDGAQTVVAAREFKRSWNADRSSFSKLTIVLPGVLRAGQTSLLEMTEHVRSSARERMLLQARVVATARPLPARSSLMQSSPTGLRFRWRRLSGLQVLWIGLKTSTFLSASIVQSRPRARTLPNCVRAWEGRPGGGDDSPLKRRILQQNDWNQDDNSVATAGGVLYRRCPR